MANSTKLAGGGTGKVASSLAEKEGFAGGAGARQAAFLAST